MKTLVSWIVVLVMALSTAGAPRAEPPPPVEMEHCLVGRLVDTYYAAKYMSERSAVVARAAPSNPALARSLRGFGERLSEVERDVIGALTPPTSEAKLLQALVETSTRLAILRSNLARMNIALLLSTDEAAKQAVRDMSERLSALHATIPPDAPARGCR